MMATKHRSSEKDRLAHQAIMNEKRLQTWRARYTLATGREPVRVLNPPANPLHLAALNKAQAAATTNSNICKFPRRRRQIMHRDLPTTPDSAA